MDNEETPVPVLESNDVEEQANPEDIQIITPPAIQPSENIDDLSSLLNSADQIDVENISIENFQQLVCKEKRREGKKKLIHFQLGYEAYKRVIERT